MSSKVFANNMGLSHKRSGGLSSVFPDVCKTPSPGGPVPVPYPNVGRSADVRKGSKKVKIQGVSTMLEGSVYAKSTGDEAGSAGGAVSGSTRGECEFSLYSLNSRPKKIQVCEGMLFKSLAPCGARAHAPSPRRPRPPMRRPCATVE